MKTKFEAQWVSKYKESKKAYADGIKDDCIIVMQWDHSYDVWMCESLETMDTYFVIVPVIGHNITCLSAKDILIALKRLDYLCEVEHVYLPESLAYKRKLFQGPAVKGKFKVHIYKED